MLIIRMAFSTNEIPGAESLAHHNEKYCILYERTNKKKKIHRRLAPVINSGVPRNESNAMR